MQRNIHSVNNNDSTNLGLLVRLESKPGKEGEVEAFLRNGLALVEEELGTSLWFAIRLGASSFGIFDAFSDEQGRQGHLNGKVAEALFAKAPDLFSQPPIVETFETLASMQRL